MFLSSVKNKFSSLSCSRSFSTDLNLSLWLLSYHPRSWTRALEWFAVCFPLQPQQLIASLSQRWSAAATPCHFSGGQHSLVGTLFFISAFASCVLPFPEYISAFILQTQHVVWEFPAALMYMWFLLFSMLIKTVYCSIVYLLVKLRQMGIW